MSYRTRVNDVQLFGNNESYPEWDAYIRSQGIEIGEEGQYDGELKDFHAGVLALEAAVKRLMAERREEAARLVPGLDRILNADPENGRARERKEDLQRSYFDFSGYQRWLDDGTQTLFDICREIASTGYAFLPFTFWMACRDMLEQAEPGQDPDGACRIRKYKFKEGCTARVHAG